MHRPVRSGIGFDPRIVLTLAALLIGTAGCQPGDPEPKDVGPTYSTKGLAREFSFRMRALANGIPGASTGGAADAARGGKSAEEASEEKLYGDMIEKLSTIPGTTLDRATEELIEEFSKDPELTDEQKTRGAERLRALVKQPS